MSESFSERGLKSIVKRKKKMILIFACLVLIVVFGILIFTQGRIGDNKEDLLNNKDKFYKGIYVENMSIEGMTVEEAKKKVLEKVEKDCTWDMQVLFQEKVYVVEDMLSCNLDEILQEAILIGHTGDDVARLEAINNLKKNPVSYIVEGEYDSTDLKEIIDEVSGQFNVEAINADLAGYDEQTGEFIYTKSSTGYELDEKDLSIQLQTSFKEKKYDVKLQAKMESIDPDMDDTQIKEKVQLIGRFKTNTSSNENRNKNIELASDALSGILLKPGEVFSMNDITGPRTTDRGYKPAGVILNGKLVEEPGGGICQVSTTIYNAVVEAGLKTTERFSHSLEPTYVNLGEDAMVSYPNADLKFENNSKSSVLVQIKFYNRELEALIYGVPVLDNHITMEMESKVLNIIPIPKPIYEEDSSLKYGEEVTVEAGREGKKVVTYLITKENGVEISREFLHNSTYKPKTPIIRRNSKATPTPSLEPTPKPTNTIKPGEVEENETNTDKNASGEATLSSNTKQSDKPTE
jgi:vancomycin resistance protein YoaR